MRVVGITGPTGAGKTTALRAVESLGGVVFDCDKIYGELLMTCGDMLRKIGERFPGTVTEGRLDRGALAKRVFSDPEALKELNALTHPYVLREVRGRLEAARAPLAAIDAIELFESGLAELCDETVFVTAPRETRIRRIMERDGIDHQRAQARADAQNGDGYFSKRCESQLVNNFPDSREFFRYCQDFFRRYL